MNRQLPAMRRYWLPLVLLLLSTRAAWAFELTLPSTPDSLLKQARTLAQQSQDNGQKRQAAERAYRVALTALRPAEQSQMAASASSDTLSCHENPAVLYDEFSDFLLAQPSAARIREAQQWWNKARQARLSAALGEACLPAGEDIRTASSASNLSSTAVVHWISSGNQLLTILAINGKQSWRSQAVDEGRLQRLVARWRRNLRGQRRSQARQAQWLSTQLIKPLQQLLAELPIEQRQAITQLRIVADDPLLDLPWAALALTDADGRKRYLGEEFALSINASLTRLPVEPPPKTRVLFAATPDIAIDHGNGETALPLPASREEWRGIQRDAAATQLLNRAVTQARLLDKLAAHDYSVLHLALHGQLAADPRDSYVLLADGRLPLAALGDLVRERRYSQQPLSLLVLSGCETALSGYSGADIAGGSRYGLAGVALQAGARSALASLWSVDDAATAELMTLFYAQLNKQAAASRSPAQALRAAQTQLRTQSGYDAPFYWAAFQMIGDWQ